MENSDIKLFKHDQNNIILPSMHNVTPDEDLKSGNIDKDISGEEVKIIQIKEDTEIEENNFIIDLTDIGQITASQKEVIKSLVTNNGSTAIYLYRKQGLIKLGYGDKYTLERILPLVKLHVFDNTLRIYKNFKRDSAVEEISSKDITKLRLQL